MKRRIAIPVENNILSAHFGHAPVFRVYDTEDHDITDEGSLVPPPHAPGVIPEWLAEQGVTDVITGGIGQRAITIFNDHGVNVYTGAERKDADILAKELINGNLIAGQNLCDH